MNNVATARTPAQARRSLKQSAVLQNGCKNVVCELGSRVPPRSDHEYVRPKARRRRPELPAPKLLEAVLWMHTRRGREWESVDDDTIGELKARTWGEVQCRCAATHHVPTWLLAALPGRTSYGCALFCYFVLAAHRAGALGLLVSYTELAALCGVSDRTTARWAKRLEKAGMVEIVQTWQRNPNKNGPKRGFWKHLYRPGPKMREIAGLGMLEGAAGLSESSANFARRCARVARARLRKAQRTRSDALWRLRNGKRAAPVDRKRSEEIGRELEEIGRELEETGAANAPPNSDLRVDMLASPSPSAGGRGIRPSSSLRGMGVPPTAPHEKAGPPGPRVSGTPAANASNRVAHRSSPSSQVRVADRASKMRARDIDAHSSSSPSSSSSSSSSRSPSPSSSGPTMFAAWLEANEPPPKPPPKPLHVPRLEDGEQWCDPYAEQRQALAKARRARRKKNFSPFDE